MKEWREIRVASALLIEDGDVNGHLLLFDRLYHEVLSVFHPLGTFFWSSVSGPLEARRLLLKAAVLDNYDTGMDYLLWTNTVYGISVPMVREMVGLCENGGLSAVELKPAESASITTDSASLSASGRIDSGQAGMTTKGSGASISAPSLKKGKAPAFCLIVSKEAIITYCKAVPPSEWFSEGLAEGGSPEKAFLSSIVRLGGKVGTFSPADRPKDRNNTCYLSSEPYRLPEGVGFLPGFRGAISNQPQAPGPKSIVSATIDALTTATESKGIAVYGAGTLAKSLMPLLGQKVKAVVDKNPDCQGKGFSGFTVLPPEALAGFAGVVDTVLITAVGAEREIRKYLRELLGEGIAGGLRIQGLSGGEVSEAGRGLEVNPEAKPETSEPGKSEPGKIEFGKITHGKSEPGEIEHRKNELKKTRHRQLTRRAVLYTGYPCNVRCVFCYYTYFPSKEWHSIEECKRDAHVYRFGYDNEWVDITGGEPTIYPQILELLDYCGEIGLTPTLITNMQVLAKEDTLASFKSHGVYDFLCSVHALSDTYDMLTKKRGAWGNLLKAIDNFGKLDVKWRVNCTMTNINRRQLQKIAEFVYLNGARVINFINYNPFHEWSLQKNIDFQSRHSDIEPYLREALDYCDEAGLEANVRYFPFCRMKGHENKCYNFSQLSYDPHEWDFSSWYSDKTRNPSEKIPAVALNATSGGEDFHLYMAQRMKRALFCQAAECRFCALGFICDGFTRQYAARFGMEEVLPYGGDLIVDPKRFNSTQDKVVDER
ncbi:MAG: radical SAM protein [Nitrospirae bacterium]|nr:radical SAM protein [Nitrospirota bacterium]